MTIKNTSTSKPVLIRLKNIIKSFAIEGRRIEVLRRVSLSIGSGELLAIVGASGSGKSTLMNILGLLDSPDSGEYWLNHDNVASNVASNVTSLDPDAQAELRNRSIGFVFQHFNLLARATVLQNVGLPLTYRQMPTAEIDHRVHTALARVGMQAFSKHRPSQLSGGQQQRVAIARALIGEPALILADEPTGALDSRTGGQILDLFLEMHAEGRTVILVTHDEKIANQTERRIMMADGNTSLRAAGA